MEQTISSFLETWKIEMVREMSSFLIQDLANMVMEYSLWQLPLNFPSKHLTDWINWFYGRKIELDLMSLAELLNTIEAQFVSCHEIKWLPMYSMSSHQYEDNWSVRLLGQQNYENYEVFLAGHRDRYVEIRKVSNHLLFQWRWYTSEHSPWHHAESFAEVFDQVISLRFQIRTWTYKKDIVEEIVRVCMQKQWFQPLTLTSDEIRSVNRARENPKRVLRVLSVEVICFSDGRGTVRILSKGQPRPDEVHFDFDQEKQIFHLYLDRLE